ncbi:MAG: CDP-archaeol synthase [Verrucomicrobiota bacterium]
MASKQEIRLRTISSLILWSVVLFLLFWDNWLGRIGCWVVITFFGLMGQWEFYQAVGARGFLLYRKSGLFCGLLLFLSSLWFLILQPELADFSWVAVSAILVASIVGGLIRMVVAGPPRENPVVSLGLTVFGLVYVPYLFNYVCRVAFLEEPLPPGHTGGFILLYLLVVTKMSDVGAFVFGSLFGRHKMAPNISPGKTWQGFAGGCLTSLASSLLLMALCGGQLAGLQWLDAVILGLLLPVAAAIGDLAESVVKRDFRIKDSGTSIPGIGGALDLIDSILFTAPVLYFYLYFITLA